MSCPIAMGVLVQWNMKVLLPAPVCPMTAIKVSVGFGTMPSRRAAAIMLPVGEGSVSNWRALCLALAGQRGFGVSVRVTVDWWKECWLMPKVSVGLNGTHIACLQALDWSSSRHSQHSPPKLTHYRPSAFVAHLTVCGTRMQELNINAGAALKDWGKRYWLLLAHHVQSSLLMLDVARMLGHR
jgi:hypothetical protein